MTDDLTQLRAELAAFDQEVAWHLENEGERADLWPDIDVPVASLRALLDALDALQAERDHWRNYSSGQGKLIESGVFVKNEEYAKLAAAEARVTALEKGLEIERQQKNKLVLAAYPAMDAIDAIRKWCDEQQYENDTITVAKLRAMLPPSLAEARAQIAAIKDTNQKQYDEGYAHGLSSRLGPSAEYVRELREENEKLKAALERRGEIIFGKEGD